MASSFDELTPEQTAVLEQPDLVPAVDVFTTVTALYSFYRCQDANLRIRGGTRIRNGEADEQPIDFVLDVELKARRALDPVEFAYWDVLGKSEDSAKRLMPELRCKLNLAWQNLINFGYPQLFAKAQRAWKNQQRELNRKADSAKGHAEQAAQQAAQQAATLLADSDPFAANISEDTSAPLFAEAE